MSRLEWDKAGEKLYHVGVDKVVLYHKDSEGKYPKGVPWNGVTAVNESPSGAESTKLHANNTQYHEIRSAEEFGYTIEAYMYPDEFAECDGSKEIAKGIFATQQTRKRFGLAYRTLIGNDVNDTDHGYEIHLVYDSTASPSSKDHGTINETIDPSTMSWECSTVPVSADALGIKPTAHIIIDSTKCSKEDLKKIEDILYGSENGEARLPLPDELASLATAISYVDNDGSKIPVPATVTASDNSKQTTK